MVLGSAGLVSAGSPFQLLGKIDALSVRKLTILHTNDVHSRLDPFPLDGSKLQGLGGVAKRSALVKSIKQSEPSVLLFDCGDIVQGTPYFNMFFGRPEFEVMSLMGYDAGTVGNHDFDMGVQHLADLCKYANFPLLNINYNIKNSPLHDQLRPYKIFNKGGIRVGVFGVGIQLKGLVMENNFKDIIYEDPIKVSNEMAQYLKHEEKCDLVVCLSHLGYQYKKEPNKVSDVILAENSRNIDIILGGHTHTFLDEPDMRKNLDGHTVLVNQVGWAGLRLGRIDIIFEKSKKNFCATCDNIWIRN